MVGAWVRLLVKSAVVAAVAVAAQLGAGDALGVIQWDGPHDSRAWSTLLTWLAFSYAVAVLAGAMVGRIAVRRQHSDDGIGAWLTASIVAAGGAAAAIGLAWLPAQFLTPPTNVNPGLVVSLTAGAGVVVGLVLALLALAARPIAVGLQVMASWLWLVAIGAAVAGLTTGHPFPAPRLGVPDAPSLLPESPWVGSRVLIISAVVIGVVVPGVARWRGSGRLSAALSGLGGPALVAAAYLVAGKGDAGAPQAEPYQMALLATAAGLLASVLVAMPGRRGAPAPRAQVPDDEGPLQGDVIEVVRTPTTPVPAQGRARPAWADGSGPYARAYAASALTGAGAAAGEPTTTRGYGWDADTLSGTGSAGRHAQPQESAGAGVYRSTSTDRTDSEPWLPDLGAGGRHAATD